MIYVPINAAFYHKGLVAKCPLGFERLPGHFGGSVPYGVNQIAQDQPAIGIYQLRALLLNFTKNN